MITSYQNLVVWQKGIQLVKEVYKLTAHFPREEIYGLTNQMRRSAVSIPSNIAEGYTRKHKQEYIQFIRIAFGSGAELETQMKIAKELNFAAPKLFEPSDALLNEIMRMLNRFIAALVASQIKN